MTAPRASELVRAHEAGQRAARDGARVEDCPYRVRTTTALTMAWLNGYVSGRRDDR